MLSAHRDEISKQLGDLSGVIEALAVAERPSATVPVASAPPIRRGIERVMSQPNAFAFKTVRHGYDPLEVDRHVAELSPSPPRAAQQQAEELAARVRDLEKSADERKVAAKPLPPAEPTFHDFGKRIGRILAMAEEEAEEMRGAAVAEVAQSPGRGRVRRGRSARRGRRRTPARPASGADEHAARMIEDAKRSADQMADEAERMAIARSGEAEALYEEQRARAAKAAADFEQTLAERRDKAEAMFQERTEMAEQRARAARNRVAKLRAEGDQMQAEAARRAQQLQAEAERKAEQIVAERWSGPTASAPSPSASSPRRSSAATRSTPS